MFSTRIVKAALWGLVGALLVAYPVQADMFVVAGGGKSYKNVVVVAKSGSPYTSVQAALDAINGASDSNRHLIFVAPGTYDGRFTMEPYVDIAGSGPNVTILQAPGGTQSPINASYSPGSATCVGSDNAAIGNLTLKNTGGYAYGVAFYSYGTSPTLDRVRMEAAGATSHNYGLFFYGGVPNIKNSTSIVSDAGNVVNTAAFNMQSHATYQNCDLGAYYGTHAYGMVCLMGEVNLQNCRLLAKGATTANYGMKNSEIGADVLIRHSQIAANGTGTTAIQYGQYNTHGTSVKMFSSQVEARYGSETYGVYNTWFDIEFPPEAVFAYRCSIQAVSATSSNTGVFTEGRSGHVAKTYLNQCDIEGATNSVANGAYVDTYIGASWLNGPTDAGIDFATMTCAGCYGAGYSFGAGSCP